jgi:addiction module RelE/StbE family toxin
MVRDLIWTNRALKRLDDIPDFIARDNPLRAKTFVIELSNKLEVLKTQSLGRSGRVFGTKELVLHPNYLAVYRIKANQVQVLTILHTARNK